MFKNLSYILFLLFITSFPVLSQNNLFIFATVNEKIITNYDINKEIEYLKVLNPNLTELDEKQIFNISKESLINEIIKKSEIKKFLNFEDNNSMVDDTYKNLYKRLNFNDENEFRVFLNKKSFYTDEEIKEKLKIELLWNELIYLKYNNQVKIDK